MIDKEVTLMVTVHQLIVLIVLLEALHVLEYS